LYNTFLYQYNYIFFSAADARSRCAWRRECADPLPLAGASFKSEVAGGRGELHGASPLLGVVIYLRKAFLQQVGVIKLSM